MADEKIIIDIEIDNEKASQELLEVEKQLQKVRSARAELNKEIATAKKEGKELTDEQIKQSIQLEKEQKALSDQKRRLVKETETEKNSVNALRLEIAKLTAIRSNLNTQTEEGAKQFAELTKQLKKYNEDLNDSSKAAGNFKDNIGNYTDSIKEAFSVTEILEGGLKGLGEALTKGVKDGIGLVNQAFLLLAANPVIAAITALVAVVALLINSFLKTEKGAEKIQQIFAGLEPIFNLVQSALAGVGEILFSVIEGLTDGINLVADLFGLGAAESKNLTKELQGIEKQIIKNEAAQKGLRAEEERLRKVRDDESKSFPERIAASEKLGKIEKERIDGILKLEQRKLEILERQLEAIPENLRTTEDLQKLEEQRAKVNELIEESQGIQAEQIQSQNSLIRDQNALRNETRQVLLDLEVAQGKVNETSDEFLRRQKEIVNERRKAQLQETEDATARVKINAEADLEILNLTKDFNDKRVSAYQSYVAAVQEQNEAAKQAQIANLQDQIAGYELQLLQLQEGSAEFIRVRNEALKLANQLELLEFQGTQNQRLLLIQNQATAELQAVQSIENQKIQIVADASKIRLGIESATEKDFIKIKQGATKARVKLDEIEGDSAEEKFEQIGQATGAVGQILGEQTAAGKFFASLQAGINAILAVSQTIADPSLPWFLKIPTAILIGKKALEQVKKINEVPVPGGGGGGGGDESLSISGGGGGNSPNFVPAFLNSGVVQNEAATVSNQVEDQNTITSAVTNQREIIVKVRDIELGEDRRAAKISQSTL